MPKVSVIIPNYNHAPYLTKRIESILNQTFQDFELILMDDCSSDQSVEVLKKYENHPKVSKLIVNESNSGSTFKQWNKGVQLARGEYIWIAESDDWADESFLEKLLAELSKYNNVGIAYAQSYEVDSNDQILGSRLDWTEDLNNSDKWINNHHNTGVKEINENLFIKNTIPNVSATIINRSAYLTVGLANPNFKYIGDWDLYARILADFDVIYIAEHLNFNRKHLQTQRTKRMNTLLAVNEILLIAEFIKPILGPTELQIVYHNLSHRWLKALSCDKSAYSFIDMRRHFLKFYPYLISNKINAIYLMLKRLISPFF